MISKKIYLMIFCTLIVLMFILPSSVFADADEIPQNGIPLVIIRVDESVEAIDDAKQNDPEHEYGTISDMNESKHHTTRCVGTVEIIVPDDFESQYDLKDHPIGEQKISYIRGRGNSTWMISSKKPYKIKYDKKQDVLGMGKNKEWGLLANSFDPTLTHNAIASWFGEQLGMEFTPKMVPVDVVMIGSESGREYLGSYYLTELVDIGKNRVDIHELDENETENITGGYLMSIYYDDQDFKEPENTVFETEYSKIKLINENPYFNEGDLTSGQEFQRTYIRDYINQIDDLIMNNEVIDENIHNQIAELLDLKSTADFWLIQEFFVNFDGYKTSSNYLYKKENGKLYWGPLWDFDLMLYMVDEEELSHIMGFNKSLPFPWLDKLRNSDPEFVKLLKEEWSIINEKLIELTEENGILTQLKERQRKAWNANYELWKEANYYGNETSIDKEFEKFYTIVDLRRNWFNENINNIGKIYCTIDYEIDGKIVRTDTIRTDSLLEKVDLKPQKEGLLFDGWVDKATGEKVEYTKILNDVVLIPKYVNPNDIEEEIIFFLKKYEDWVSLDEGEYENSPKIFPEDYHELIFNNITWTSSNENVATVENGVVSLKSVGEVTITATIYNGTSKSFILHVFDDSYETINEPEDFIIENDSITIEIGEIAQIVSYFVPNKPLNPNYWLNVEREISDTDIIDVDYSDCYVVKGLKEGIANIVLNVYSSFSDDHIFSKIVTVTVVPKSEKKEELTILEGGDQTYKKGENLIIRASGDFSKFSKLQMDGVDIPEKYYEKWEGSTVVSLKSEYLATLSTGNHTLTFLYNDGSSVSTSVKIAQSEDDSKKDLSLETNPEKLESSKEGQESEIRQFKKSMSPKTGDNIVDYIVLFVISILGIILLFKKKIDDLKT